MTYHVGYLSDLNKDYQTGLRAVKSLKELRAHVQEWREIAYDAFERVQTMSEADYSAYQKGLIKEISQKFAGEKWVAEFGMILLPHLLLRVGMSVVSYGIPVSEGLMFKRMCDFGWIKQTGDGVYYWDEPEEEKKPKKRSKK